MWAELLKIPHGQTRSYQELAKAVGTPKAPRAVGHANGMNRIAIVIPCHRVVNKDGRLGGYGGGLWRKHALLHLERTGQPLNGLNGPSFVARPRKAGRARARTMTRSTRAPCCLSCSFSHRSQRLPPTPAGRSTAAGRVSSTSKLPRIEESVTIDGALDEPAWQQAARAHRLLAVRAGRRPAGGRADRGPGLLLADGDPLRRPGPRAAGTVHATLANRDNIDADDSIQIFLSTFNDGRQALVFGVNPLGVQADGTLVEGARGAAAASRRSRRTRETPDLTPDFVFQSKGRLTDEGYEVEVRIPFKSLRYQTADVQDWGLNVMRKVQSTGHEDSWAPAQRAAASFLAQSGTLDGLDRPAARPRARPQSRASRRKADGAPAAGRLELRRRTRPSSAATCAGA